MCGVMAVLSPDKKLRASNFDMALKQILHRGPDSQNSWMNSDQTIWLGHVRLSILDLNHGDHPIANENHSIQIVGNGEFYDFERIRKELEKAGHRFRTKSDSEIAIHLYEKSGTQCLQHLRGEFAFLIWDENRRMLFAARDRFGIKPLYYAQHNGDWYFSSEVKSLLAAGVPGDWDHEALYQYASTFNPIPGRSLYKNIFEVPAGHYAVVTEYGLQLHKYWDLALPLKKRDKESEGDLMLEYRGLLEESVRLRLRADVPVGCYLSGGLDSCTILGFAAKHSEKPMNAYTLTFEDAEYDESVIAQEMAKFAGANYHPILIKQEDIADNFGRAIYHSESIGFNGHGVPKFLLSEFVRKSGVKVVLTGEGADETNLGYTHFIEDVMRAQMDPTSYDPNQLMQSLNISMTGASKILLPDQGVSVSPQVQKILGYIPTYFKTYASVHTKLFPFWAKDFSNQFAHRDPFEFHLNFFNVADFKGMEPVDVSAYIWLKGIFIHYIVCHLGDRMEMSHSIEGRPAFLDHKLVEFVMSLPTKFKIKGNSEKYLLREAARPYITDTIYRRPKHPFMSPPSTLSPKGKLMGLVQDTFRSTDFKNLGLFRQDELVSLLDRMPDMSLADRASYDRVFMVILSLFFIHKNVLSIRPIA